MTDKVEKKKASPKAKVRIQTEAQFPELEEVFITCDDPYVNRVVYAKPGVFTEGEFALDELEKKAEG